LAVFGDVPSSILPAALFEGAGMPLVDVLADARVKLAPSKSEARRLVQSGGVYVNNVRASDVQQRLARERAIDGQLFVLRKGQKQNHVIRVV
jgi:tyrosyl-tRNA synthetase